MGRIDAEFAEDVLAMGGDGVDTRKPFVGNLFRRLALRDGPHNLRFRLCQDTGMLFVLLLLADDDLQCPLTDMALVLFFHISILALAKVSRRGQDTM